MTVLDDSIPHVPGYEIVGLLGRGGCGTVFVATQQGLSRKVALKVLSGDALPSKSIRRRFQREAQALASVQHPGIVEVLAFQGDGKTPYLVMELLSGGTLRKQLEHAPKGLPPEACVRLARELLEALAALHDAEMIHRDVKPSNVLFREDGQAVLGDLGVVHVALEGATRMTGSHELLGTLAYFAPELYRKREPTIRSDLFALGVTLYEAVTGQHPTEFRPFSKDFQVVDPRGIVPDCPPALGALVRKLTANDPDKRPVSAYAALEMLDSTDAPPLGSTQRRASKRRPAISGAAMALAVGLGLGLTAGVWLGVRQARHDPELAAPPLLPVPHPASASPAAPTGPAVLLAKHFGPVKLVGLARWPQPTLALESTVALRAGWLDAAGQPLDAGREVAVQPGRAAIPIPAALAGAQRGVLRLAPLTGPAIKLTVDLAVLAPPPPDPLLGVSINVGSAAPVIQSPAGDLSLPDLLRRTGAGCVACNTDHPSPALESTLTRLAALPGVRTILQIAPQNDGTDAAKLAAPPSRSEWGALLAKFAQAGGAQVMVLPALTAQDVFTISPPPRGTIPAELDAAWRRDLRDISTMFTLLPPPIALSVAAMGIDVVPPGDRPQSVIAPLLHDTTAQWDDAVATLVRVTGKSDAATRTAFVWLSQRESAKDSYNTLVPDKRAHPQATLEELAMARSLVLARRAFPRSTVIIDLAYDSAGDSVSRYFVLVERTATALRGLTYTGLVPTAGSRAPRVAPAPRLVALNFAGGGRNVQVFFSDRGRISTQFVPAAPGMLCVSSQDVRARNVQRVHLDTSPIDLEMEGGLALYEELAPVTAEKLEP